MRVKNILSAVLYTVWTGKGDSQLKKQNTGEKREETLRCFSPVFL